MIPKSVQGAHTICREHSHPLGRGNHGSTRQRTPAHDINQKQDRSESAIYRIRWRSAGREDLRGFSWNPLDALDDTLRRLVAIKRCQRMISSNNPTVLPRSDSSVGYKVFVSWLERRMVPKTRLNGWYMT